MGSVRVSFAALPAIVRSFALMLFVLAAAAAPCEAQDTRARARTLFNQGVSNYEAGHYREALSAFEQAYRLAPHPAVRVNMANCFEQLGQYVEALFNYQRFLEESEEGVDSAQRDEVQLAIARLTPRVGTLKIELDPPSATLTVDDTEPKPSPGGALRLVAGTHTLRATAPGYESLERRVEVRGGEEQRVTLLLVREQPSAPVAAVDEEPAPAPEPEEAEAPETAPEPEPESEPSSPDRRRAWMWAAAGTTAAFATSFAVAGGLALKAQNDFDDAVTRSNDASLDASSREAARQEGLDAADRADLRAVLTDVFLVGTVVAGGTTLVIWLTGRKSQETRSASLNAGPMMLRRGGGGFTVGGKF